MPVTLDDWKAITASAFSNSAQQALLVRETRRACAKSLLLFIGKHHAAGTTDESIIHVLTFWLDKMLNEQGS